MKAQVLKRSIRRYLMAGLLVWIPILATVLVVRFMLQLMDTTLVLLPRSLRPPALFGMHIPGFGALLAVVLLLLTGVLVSNMIGRTFMEIWDDLLNRIPFVRGIYGGVKNFSTSLLSSSGNSFKKVLLIEYPGKGIWSIGFQTAAEVPLVAEHLGEPQVCVFIPTTPNPTAGFIVMVPQSRAIVLPVSVDEAMKMIVTLGVVMPGLPADRAAVPLPASAAAVAAGAAVVASAAASAAAAATAVVAGPAGSLPDSESAVAVVPAVRAP
ncbi:MAG TPA: DUF502 domain-containing protein [Steroidobacteraceae bacterium]|nr:DUF502 domain-containing protein [Steroidobacteraceae bacterium]